MRLVIQQINKIFDQWSKHYPLAGAVVEQPAVYRNMHEYIEGYFTNIEKNNIQEMKNKKRKASRIAGRLAVRKALAVFNPPICNDHRSKPVEILNNIHGMPFLTQHKNLHVSISHAGSLAVALVSTRKIGVDLEKIENRPKSFTQCFFKHSEQEWINKTKSNQHIRSSILWTRKEAVSKLLGVGGTISFKQIPVLDYKSIYRFHSHTLNQYCISLALHQESYL